MSSNVPPARRVHGRLNKMTDRQKAQRAAKRARKKSWAVRVWARRHIKLDSTN